MNYAFSSFGVGGTAGDYPTVGVLFYEKRERTRSRIEKVAMAKVHLYDGRECSTNGAVAWVLVGEAAREQFGGQDVQAHRLLWHGGEGVVGENVS
jgi:hypothetical protein